MTTKTILTAFLLTFCMVATSCQIGSGGSSAVGSRQFKDVVVPAGFQLRDREHESFSREEATWRHGRFIYSGRDQVDSASAYVQRRMPQHSWKLVSQEAVDENGVRLRFERGIYSADYMISKREGLTQMVVDYSTDYSRL